MLDFDVPGLEQPSDVASMEEAITICIDRLARNGNITDPNKRIGTFFWNVRA